MTGKSQLLLKCTFHRFIFSRHEPNYAATLASIIIIFFICHMPRIIKTIFEIIVTNQVIASGESCTGINPAKCLANFNNFILTLNAAASFLVYCFVGTFGTKFAEVLTSCCRRRRASSSSSSRRSGEGGHAANHRQRRQSRGGREISSKLTSDVSQC